MILAKTPLANIVRLHQFMSLLNVEAVVLRSGVNVTYLAGLSYPGTLGRHLDFVDSPRNVLVLWPREGEPVLIADLFAVPLTQRDSSISDIRSFNGYTESAYSVLKTVLSEKGLSDARLGLEFSYLNESTLKFLSEKNWSIILLWDCTLLPLKIVKRFQCISQTRPT